MRIIRGPRKTLIAGFANGVFGLWSLANGIRLEHRRIHGSVVHLVYRRPTLVAASELGQHATLDLSVFHRPYCELLRQVWQRVGVVWDKGLPRRRSPNPNHRCARGRGAADGAGHREGTPEPQRGRTSN